MERTRCRFNETIKKIAGIHLSFKWFIIALESNTCDILSLSLGESFSCARDHVNGDHVCPKKREKKGQRERKSERPRKISFELN